MSCKNQIKFSNASNKVRTIKKTQNKNAMIPFYGLGATVSTLQSYKEESLFSTASSKEFPVLISSTLEG